MLMSCISVPMQMPARMLTSAMMMLAMASPFTNFIAPSIAPCSVHSSSRRWRRFCASADDSTPARTSASMLICLPGIASSAKRAATSATRSEPFAMTMNWTIAMMRNTTPPTTTLLPTISRPKVSMMWPALACSRISLVDAMLSDSRNRVVNSSSDGKVDSDSGEGTYIATMSSTRLAARLLAMSRSSTAVGSGSTNSATMQISSAASTTSLWRPRRPASAPIVSSGRAARAAMAPTRGSAGGRSNCGRVESTRRL